MINKLNLQSLSHKKLIFFGTGRVAEKFYYKYCIEKKLLSRPIYWCDNNKEKQGTSLYDIEIISLNQVKNILQKKRTQDIAVIIMSAGINLLEMACQLERLEINYISIHSAFHIDAYYYFTENMYKVNQIADMLYDEKSKDIYRNLIHNMMYGKTIDFTLYEPNSYFLNDVIPQLKAGEVIVDAGVCNGEEIDKAFVMNKDIFVHAFEPDRNSMIKLKGKYGPNDKVKLYEAALWNNDESLYFGNNEISPSQSRVKGKAKDNKAAIQAVKLDSVLQNEVTLIKMDIEGAEYKALLGAEETIKKYHPKLTICTYHNLEDYIELPLLIKQFNDKYKFYFRQHSLIPNESVLYAI